MYNNNLSFTSPSIFLKYWLINYEKLLSKNSKSIFYDYYKSYINNYGRYIKMQYDTQSQEVVDIIKNKNGLNILEVGCGLGTESLFFALMGAKVTGIDIRLDRLNAAIERREILRNLGFNLEIEFYNKDINNLKGKYDLIWMEQAFHHIEPRQSAIKKISELLCTGGSLIISEVNAWNPFIQLMLFKKRGFKTIKEINLNGQTIVYGNERILPPFLLNSYFNDYNISKKSVRYFRLFPNRSIFNKSYLYNLEKICPQIFKPLFTHYNWVGIKNDDIKSYHL